MKKLMLMLLTIIMLVPLNINSFAFNYDMHSSEECCSEHSCLVENIADLDIPENERLVRINDDGTFLTEVINEEDDVLFSNKGSECSHRFQDVSKHLQTESYNAKYLHKCFKSRFVRKIRCSRCGKTYYNYGNWRDHGHTFSWFGMGNECTVCKYKKK